MRFINANKLDRKSGVWGTRPWWLGQSVRGEAALTSESDSCKGNSRSFHYASFGPTASRGRRDDKFVWVRDPTT
jgi:hypothetical protein